MLIQTNSLKTFSICFCKSIKNVSNSRWRIAVSCLIMLKNFITQDKFELWRFTHILSWMDKKYEIRKIVMTCVSNMHQQSQQIIKKLKRSSKNKKRLNPSYISKNGRKPYVILRYWNSLVPKTAHQKSKK